MVVLVDQVEVLEDLVEVSVVVGVVMQHEKKMILNQTLKILMIADFPCADFPCAAFSAALIVDLAGAFSWSVLASDLLLQNHRRWLSPTSFQIVGYPGVCENIQHCGKLDVIFGHNIL